MAYDVAALKGLPIREVAQQLGIEFRGERANARCFNTSYHKNGDKNPSLGLDAKTNLYKCFSCGMAGDTISLVEKKQGWDFKQSCEWLGQQFGVQESSMPSNANTAPAKPGEKAPEKENRPITDKDVEVYQHFYELCPSLSQEHRSFLHTKGFSDETIEYFGLRSIPDSAQQKIQELHSASELLESGLFKVGKNDKPGFNFYYHRLLVPYFDQERIVYLRARTIEPKAQGPRFINLTDKQTSLFNLNSLMLLSGESSLFVTEGETDCMSLHQEGKVAIGIMGATQHSLMDKLVELTIAGFGGGIEICLAFDNDKEGQAAKEYMRKALLARGVLARGLVLPEGVKDVNEWLVQRKAAI